MPCFVNLSDIIPQTTIKPTNEMIVTTTTNRSTTRMTSKLVTINQLFAQQSKTCTR